MHTTPARNPAHDREKRTILQHELPGSALPPENIIRCQRHHVSYHTIFTCIDKTFFKRLHAQRRKCLNKAFKRIDLSVVLEPTAPQLAQQPVSARAVLPASARQNFSFKKNKISLDLHDLHLLVLHIFQHQYHQTEPIQQK